MPNGPNTLRLVSGMLGGRRLRTLSGRATRPTSERVRTALFDSLRDHITEAVVLDPFAGSGALGFEALSRGARHAVFIEKNPPSVAILRANARSLGLSAQCTILAGEAANCLARLEASGPLNLVLLDPPWTYWTDTRHRSGLVDLLETLAKQSFLAPGAVISLESPCRAPTIHDELGWPFWRPPREYGRTRICLLTAPDKRP